MADYVIAGLVKRRAELAGEMRAIENRLTQIATDLSHLDAVIRQFDPDYDLTSIRPKRLREPDKAGRGEMARFVLGVLREASEPMPTSTITRLLIEARGQDVADVKRAQQIGKRVAMALRHQEGQETVRAERAPGREVLWAIYV